MKTIYLHIGAHKTGTTAIQNTLQDLQDRGLLAQHDVGIVWKEVYPLLKAAWHVPEEAHSLKKLTAYLHSVLERTGIKRLIISCEGFSSDTFLRHNNVQALAQALRGYDVRILLYIRRQDRFVESGWAQGSKVFACTTDIRVWRPHWKDLLDAYAKYFAKEHITVRIYDYNTLHMRDSACDFLQWLGLESLIAHCTPMEVNTSLSPADLRIRLSYMRQNTLSEEEQKERIQDIMAEVQNSAAGLTWELHMALDMARRGINMDAAFCLMANRLLSLEKTPQKNTHAYMSLEARKKYLAQFTEENAAIARTYLGKKDGVLFDDTMPQETISLESPTTDDLVSVFLPIFVHLSQKIEQLEEKNIGLTQEIKEIQALFEVSRGVLSYARTKEKKCKKKVRGRIVSKIGLEKRRIKK